MESGGRTVTGGTPDMIPGLPLANILDAQGHQVTAVETRSGLLAVLTQTPETGLRGGHPCLNRENAKELGMALLAFANGTSPEARTA